MPGQPRSESRTSDLLREHASVPYNPNIANAFFRAGEIEAWGRGIQRILAACREAGVPRPRFRMTGQELWTEFPFSANYLQAVSAPSAAGEGEKWGEKWGEKIGGRRVRIAELMVGNPKISTPELAVALNVSTSGVEIDLKAMRAAGMIRRVGPAKGGHWEVLR